MLQLASGEVLAGRFRLVEFVGRGGTAEVWVAHDTTLATEVALKIIPAGSAADAAEYASRLTPEVRRLRGLVHPGILQVFTVVADGPYCCIAMERVTGTDLGQARGAGFRDVVAAALQVLDALQYAHAQGVVHGDLKAGNVLRDSRGRWRLSDFRVTARAGPPPVSLSSVSPQQLARGTPTVADDIYAFGALLYDLLAGHPPLHPGITPGRIGSEVPVRLGVDGRGQPLPPGLIQLVATLLEKNPAKRPASLGGVRPLLQESLDEDGELLPAIVAPHGGRPASRDPGARPPLPSSAQRRGEKVLPAWVVYAGAGLLLAGLVAVAVLLPGVIPERTALGGASSGPAKGPTPVATKGAAPPAPAPDARVAADEALARFVRSDDAARGAGADRWGGADWLEARRLAGVADEMYRAGDFGAATASYRVASDRLQSLADGAAGQFAAATRAGAAALDSGDQAVAIQNYERALRIRPQDPGAARGLARSQKLGEVQRLMGEASARETAGDLAAARQGYQTVLALDADWMPARAALARLGAVLAQSAFERDMARGLAALSAGRSAEARVAIDSALRSRPGDPGALNALEQLNGEERRGRIVAQQAEAERLAAAEKWPEAVARYEAVLAIDSTLVTARGGLEQAKSRAALDQQLDRELARADRFNDDAIADQARAAVAAATAVVAPGPVLTEQIRRLKESLATAARPIAVRFASDNQTNVMIFKVGPLGMFTDRTVELRPGPYVVVGTRDGYRDVRRNIRVDSSGAMPPVDVRCEETI